MKQSHLSLIFFFPKEIHISETSRNWRMLKKYDPPKNWKIMGVLLLKRFQIMTHCREKCTFSASLCVVHCLLLVYTVPNISLVADVFTFFSMKSCSKLNSNDSFGFCSSWGFRNTPKKLNLIKIWLSY